LFAECGQHLYAIAPRQHDIEDNQVKDAVAGKEEPVLACLCKNDFVALSLQSFPQGLTDLWFVFDDKESHVSTFFPV
jgi:hypothetical protein